MAKLGDFIKSDDFKSEKHVPVIDVSGASADKPFTVTVTVGKEIAHPNTTEHFIQWIKLYYKEADGKVVYEVGTVEFSAHGGSAQGPNTGPVYSSPAAAFVVSVKKPGVLIAESYCNIHGLWESSTELTL